MVNGGIVFGRVYLNEIKGDVQKVKSFLVEGEGVIVIVDCRLVDLVLFEL